MSKRLLPGHWARDTRTGIEGRVEAHTEWLHRSDEIAIARDGVDNNGEPWSLLWLDTARAESAEKP
jgi:hypothetical protein